MDFFRFNLRNLAGCGEVPWSGLPLLSRGLRSGSGLTRLGVVGLRTLFTTMVAGVGTPSSVFTDTGGEVPGVVGGGGVEGAGVEEAREGGTKGGGEGPPGGGLGGLGGSGSRRQVAMSSCSSLMSWLISHQTRLLPEDENREEHR